MIKNKILLENLLNTLTFLKQQATTSHSRDSAIVITDDPVEDFQKRYNPRKSSLSGPPTISLLQNFSHPLDYNNASTSNVHNNIYRIKNSTTNFRKIDKKIMNDNVNFNKTGATNTHSISLINRNNNSFESSNINFINRSYGYEDTQASIDFIEIKPKSINEAKQKISKSLSPKNLMHRKLSDQHELLSKAPLLLAKQQYQQISPKSQMQQYQNRVLNRKSISSLAHNNTVTSTNTKSVPMFEEVIDLDAYPDSNNINQIKNKFLFNALDFNEINDKNYKCSLIDKRISDKSVISTAHSNAMYKKPSTKPLIQHASTHPYSSVSNSAFNTNFSSYSQNHFSTKHHSSSFKNETKKHKINTNAMNNTPLNLSMKPMVKAPNNDTTDDQAQPLNLAFKQKNQDDAKINDISYGSGGSSRGNNAKLSTDEDKNRPAESNNDKDNIDLEFFNSQTNSTPLSQEETNSSRSSPSTDRVVNAHEALKITEEISNDTAPRNLEDNQNVTSLETDNTTAEDSISASPSLVTTPTNSSQRKFTYAPLTGNYFLC